MGLAVIEFSVSRDRRRVNSGEPFEVTLESEWNPPSDSGTEKVELFCETTGFSVSPSSISVTIDAGGETVSKRFRITIHGHETELVDIVARAASGSQDSFPIHVRS